VALKLKNKLSSDGIKGTNVLIVASTENESVWVKFICWHRANTRHIVGVPLESLSGHRMKPGIGNELEFAKMSSRMRLADMTIENRI
jgi:hypothetical protein